jgi:ribosomal peptide maturation radical SAM protein 1
MKRVLLINMPFAEVTYPSLALGLFKTRFQNEGIPCDVEYLNILFAEMVGLENYSTIGQMTSLFAGEQMFAHTLFGNYVPDNTQYYVDVVSKVSLDMQYRLQRMKTQVIPFLQYCLERIPWYSYDIIGFTSLFEQNLPSIALAYQIKRHFPNKIIVFGGANCEDTMGLTMHRCFSFIDYVCSGEADNTFPELVKRLIYGHSIHDLPGIVYRDNGKFIYTGKAPKIHELDSLPFPNYDEYFQRLRNSSLATWINPFLLLETSRGCWWGEKRKCTFCGLNGQNLKFRSKSTTRIIDEILYLTQRYNIPYIRAVDNVINLDYFKNLLPEIVKMNLNVQLTFEVRSTLQKHQIKMLAEAGVTYIQAGIENLSTHILKLMRKGTSALQNIQFLKWCKQYGIKSDWNIIFGFPGEVPDDYARCLEFANVLTHLDPPLGFGPFRMDRFSYNFDNASELGLIKLRPLNIYKYLYPFDEGTLFDLVYYFDFDYEEKIDDGGFLAPLTEQVLSWKDRQHHLYSQSVNNQLLITDNRPVATSTQIVLHGIRRYIYEYCDRIRSIKRIEQWLKECCQVTSCEDHIKKILAEYIDKKLMVKEKNLYLSLAVMTYTPEFEIEEN